MTDHQNAVREEALRYARMGLSVIPLRPRDKKPLVKWVRYQKEHATPDQIEKWAMAYPDMNIGIVTGSISGIVVVDIEQGGDASEYPPTVSVKTGGLGWHLYYSLPKGTNVSSGARKRELTDIRGEGGYVAAPPSVHPSGNSYEWIERLESVEELPPFPSYLFNESRKGAPSVPSTSWKYIPQRGVAEGERNSEATRYVGGLLRTIPEELWMTAGWGGLKELNATFLPPLSDPELRGVFESIANKESTRRGSVEKPDTHKPFEVFSLRDLYSREFPEVSWVVKDLIELGSLSVLTGDSNSFKTFLAQNLAGNVLDGTPFLGHFATTKGKVLFVDEENPPRITRKRFEDLGIPESDDIRFISYGGFRADVDTSIKHLREAIDEFKPILVILDSLIDMHSKNENDAQEMTAVINAIRQGLLMEERSIVIIHHHRKVQPGMGSRPGQNMRGSTGIRGAVDGHIAVDRKGANDLLITQDKLRLQEQLKPFKASLVLTETAHLAFAYQGEDRSHEEALVAVQDAILDVVFKADEPMTIKDLIAATGASESQVRAGVAVLMDTGEVAKRAGPHNTALYSLAITTSDTDNSSPEEVNESQQKLDGSF